MQRLPYFEFMSHISVKDKIAIYDLMQVEEPVQFKFDEALDMHNENQAYNKIRTHDVVMQQPTIQNMITKRSSEYFFGMQFDIEDPKNNQIEVSNIKRILLNDIQASPVITSNDKKAWIDALENNQDISVIERIKQDFDAATNRARLDKTVKEGITIVCQYVNKNYFNGNFFIGGQVRLPPMQGSEQDFIQFYMSPQVQSFMYKDQRGIKIQKVLTNPCVDLCVRLVMRGVRNTIQMKQQGRWVDKKQLVQPKKEEPEDLEESSSF